MILKTKLPARHDMAFIELMTSLQQLVERDDGPLGEKILPLYNSKQGYKPGCRPRGSLKQYFIS